LKPMILRIDHVSMAVRDYDKAEQFFRTVLGLVPGVSATDPHTKYFWQIFSVGDLSRFELIRPTGPGSFLDNFLSDKQGGVHHITVQASDIRKVKENLDKNGIPYFGYNEYPGGVWKELFIHPKYAFGVLIQIAEFEADDWISDDVKLPGKKRWEVEHGEGGIRLNLSHPGGGTMKMELSRDEARALLADLRDKLGE
jgi:methylmalonyl-CoA/ethylmalonyl-CoA epimerase